MKIMYTCRLGLDTKCPRCKASIMSIGSSLYACQSGHVIECVVLVTVNEQDRAQASNQPTTQPKSEDLAPQAPKITHQTSAIQTDAPILPPKSNRTN